MQNSIKQQCLIRQRRECEWWSCQRNRMCAGSMFICRVDFEMHAKRSTNIAWVLGGEVLVLSFLLELASWLTSGGRVGQWCRWPGEFTARNVPGGMCYRSHSLSLRCERRYGESRSTYIASTGKWRKYHRKQVSEGNVSKTTSFHHKHKEILDCNDLSLTYMSKVVLVFSRSRRTEEVPRKLRSWMIRKWKTVSWPSNLTNVFDISDTEKRKKKFKLKYAGHERKQRLLVKRTESNSFQILLRWLWRRQERAPPGVAEKGQNLLCLPDTDF